VTLLLLLTFPFFLVGFALRHWSALIVPIVVWSLDTLAREVGWWGNGNGDLWQALTVYFIVVGVTAALLGVKGGRALDRRLRRHRVPEAPG
jgi:hypothetical protein